MGIAELLFPSYTFGAWNRRDVRKEFFFTGANPWNGSRRNTK